MRQVPSLRNETRRWVRPRARCKDLRSRRVVLHVQDLPAVTVQRQNRFHIFFQYALWRNLPQLLLKKKDHPNADLSVLGSRHQKRLLEGVECKRGYCIPSNQSGC